MTPLLNEDYSDGVDLIAVTLFFRLNAVGLCLELSNDTLGILVAQGATKLSEINVGVRKKLGLDPGPHMPSVDWAERQKFFSDLQP